MWIPDEGSVSPADRGLGPVLSPGRQAARAQHRPQSQLGVSFPAIQGGRDLRPPLRAPIWRLIPRKYGQVSPSPTTSAQPPSSPSKLLHRPSIPPSLPHFSSSEAPKPRKFKASVRARANPRAAFPRARADEILFFARKNYRGREEEKTENKVKQTVRGRWRTGGVRSWSSEIPLPCS